MNTKQYDLIKSDEVQELLSDRPEWIVRHGVLLISILISILIVASALIDYPEIIKADLKVNSLNAPKAVIAKQGGKLTNLLVKDGQLVEENQVLAYFESAANPNDVLKLLFKLKEYQTILFSAKPPKEMELPRDLNLGEIQGSFQNFYQEYLQYQLTQKGGFYLRKIAFLEKDIRDIEAIKEQITNQIQVQKQEYLNNKNEYEAYKKLYEKKVISRSEFVQQENKHLMSKYPLQQSETALLNNSLSYGAKEKELVEIRSIVAQQRAKFIQALNQCITDCDSWVLQYVLRASINGKLSFAGIIQQNQNIAANQEVFVINPGNTDFFGEVMIPQYNMGNIKIGQHALIKLKGYPYEQYGKIKGRLTYISDVAYRDSVFIAKISIDGFEYNDSKKKILLKNGMQAGAEIITEESTLLTRFFRSMIRIIKDR